MNKKTLSRREFLRAGALTTVGLIAVGCGAASQPEQVAAPEEVAAVTEAPSAVVPAAEEVTLDFVTILNEYDGPYRQIWDIFEAEHPGIKVNSLSENMDTLSAYNAKRAGGYFPALEDVWLSGGTRNVNRDNYERWIDLSTTDFPWWDRWTYDVKNMWPNIYKLPGPRSVDPFQGLVFGFQYRVDVMNKIGWDPQEEVKTYDDLKKLCADLKKFADEDDSLDFGWDIAWHNTVAWRWYINYIPLIYPDGSLERQYDCWMGKAKFNAEDSPYRRNLEVMREFYNNGWHPENWWNREWETDMEASFIAGKSAMMLHGPWVYDKALAADPDIQQAGFPLPSVDGKPTVWIDPPPFAEGYGIPSENENTPVYEQVKIAFYWWNSPAVVKMRAEVEGRNVEYKLDKPLQLSSPQYLGYTQYIEEKGWEITRGPWGPLEASGYQIGGSKGVWDRGGGSMNKPYGDTILGKLSIHEFLDQAQANWEESFEGLPVA